MSIDARPLLVGRFFVPVVVVWEVVVWEVVVWEVVVWEVGRSPPAPTRDKHLNTCRNKSAVVA